MPIDRTDWNNLDRDIATLALLCDAEHLLDQQGRAAQLAAIIDSASREVERANAKLSEAFALAAAYDDLVACNTTVIRSAIPLAVLQEMISEIRAGRKNHAVVACHESTNLGIRAAKDLVEAIQMLPIEPPTADAATSTGTLDKPPTSITAPNVVALTHGAKLAAIGVPPEKWNGVIAMVRKDKKINAIKAIRAETGCSLTDANNIVKEIAASMNGHAAEQTERAP